MTKNSKLILDIVASSHDHMTAEQIFMKAKEIYPSIVLATVYNNLKQLTQENLIRKITFPGKPDCYDNTTIHDHLVCDHCGKIADITIPDIYNKITAATGSSFIKYDLNIHYLCPECHSTEVVAP